MFATNGEPMDMTTAIANAKKARKEFDQAIETYEAVRTNVGPSASVSALLVALVKARQLGWAVEDLERVSAEGQS
jgi:hypothetical protein